MWDTLFSGLISVVILVGLYYAFLSDWVYEKYTGYMDYRTKYTNVDKMAMVKLVSDDSKGIEMFVNQNAQYLSKTMVQKLVDRIETIKFDSTIENDDVLKKRIAELKVPDELYEGPASFDKVNVKERYR